jgi:hypothetical protein
VSGNQTVVTRSESDGTGTRTLKSELPVCESQTWKNQVLLKPHCRPFQSVVHQARLSKKLSYEVPDLDNSKGVDTEAVLSKGLASTGSTSPKVRADRLVDKPRQRLNKQSRQEGTERPGGCNHSLTSKPFLRHWPASLWSQDRLGHTVHLPGTLMTYSCHLKTTHA